MARFFACGGLGVFLTLAASVLAIFAHISQINNNIVPRNLRMVTVDTTGLGAALGVGDAVYGTGARTAAGSGLRRYYEWGLWTYSEKDSRSGSSDYSDATTWAHEFRPTSTLLFDVPSQYSTEVSGRLPSGVFTSDSYLGRFSKAAFYLLFIGTVIGGLAFIVGFLAHRFAFLLSAVLAFLGFLCLAVGCIIWTVIIARTKHSINGAGVGITASYGDALWVYWAATGCLLFATLPYLLGCVAGRDRY